MLVSELVTVPLAVGDGLTVTVVERVPLSELVEEGDSDDDGVIEALAPNVTVVEGVEVGVDVALSLALAVALFKSVGEKRELTLGDNETKAVFKPVNVINVDVDCEGSNDVVGAVDDDRLFLLNDENVGNGVLVASKIDETKTLPLTPAVEAVHEPVTFVARTPSTKDDPPPAPPPLFDAVAAPPAPP